MPYLFTVDIGSTLARMVLRCQAHSVGPENTASSSEVPVPEALEQFNDWTFISETFVDSVFGPCDDLDSEGILCKNLPCFYIHLTLKGSN